MESAYINKHNIEFLQLNCLPNAGWDMLYECIGAAAESVFHQIIFHAVAI